MAMLIAFYSFIAFCAIQTAYYSFFLIQGLKKRRKAQSKKIGISLLVCAKNEAENLKQFVPLLLEQNYPEFQIVLINDASQDESLYLMQDFEKLHPNVKVVDVKEVDSFWNNKKYPLTLGIKAAKYDYLLFTDADCYPSSKNWISEMSKRFSNEKKIVLGYGAYEKQAGSFLNKLIRFETLLTAKQYMSYASAGNPYMGVGRNLAYRRDVFFEANGFQNHLHLNSGDDDLFINQVATKQNTEICLNSDGFTYSVPENSFKSWIKQKKRHISTSYLYKPFQKFLLGLFYFSQLSFWILSILLLVLCKESTLIWIIIASRFFISYLSYALWSKKLKETDLIFVYPLLELFLIVSQLFIFISNLSTKKNNWR